MPIGRRSVKASLPSPACAASIGTISPASLRASTAAKVDVDIAREVATRAALRGLAAPPLQRFARVVRDLLCDLLVPAGDAGDRLDEDLRALVRRQRLAQRPLRLGRRAGCLPPRRLFLPRGAP